MPFSLTHHLLPSGFCEVGIIGRVETKEGSCKEKSIVLEWRPDGGSDHRRLVRHQGRVRMGGDPQYPDDADDLAMARLADGEGAALDEMMGRWAQPVTRFLMRMVGDIEVATDLAQEAFVRLYEARRRYRAGSGFRGWLFTIAANLARNHNRWRARHPTERLGQEEGEGIPDPPDPRPHPDSEIEMKELAAAVRMAVARLPEDLRVALILSEYEDLSQEEIARAIGCSRKAVEMRLYRARAEMRKYLSSPL